MRRAQWKISQPPSLERNEQAWREHLYRSMRAVEGSLGHSPQERFRELEEPISRCAVGKPPGPPRLARLARRSCSSGSFGSSGLSGFSSFFGSPDVFSGPANKTDRTNKRGRIKGVGSLFLTRDSGIDTRAVCPAAPALQLEILRIMS